MRDALANSSNTCEDHLGISLPKELIQTSKDQAETSASPSQESTLPESVQNASRGNQRIDRCHRDYHSLFIIASPLD